MKFGVQMQILVKRMAKWQRIKNFANSYGGCRYIENRFWTTYCPINAKFGMKKHNHAQTQVTWSN